MNTIHYKTETVEWEYFELGYNQYIVRKFLAKNVQ